MDDFDNPWKEVLERFFPAFLALFFPEVGAAIDWGRGYESLDKELQQIVHEAELGKRLADKLFKVWLKVGQEAWILIHIEVQSQPEAEFCERMFVYHYRIFDRYRRPVVSLAVLGDDRHDWRPTRFEYSWWGCKLVFEFPVVKLLDYADQAATLENHPNPFAPVVLAHVKTLETRNDPQDRRLWKTRLVKGLFERGLDGEEIRQLFRAVDWMMTLPKELENQFTDEIREFEEERKMPYITSVERIGMEKGRREGLRQGIEVALEAKFGAEGLQLMAEVNQLHDVEALVRVVQAIRTTATVDELRGVIRSQGSRP